MLKCEVERSDTIGEVLPRKVKKECKKVADASMIPTFCRCLMRKPLDFLMFHTSVTARDNRVRAAHTPLEGYFLVRSYWK